MPPVVTFVGKSFAKPGFRFIYHGVNPACPKTCNLYATCQANLKPNTVYEITDVMARKMDCPKDFHEEQMVLVKLELPKLLVSVESKNLFVGSIVNYSRIACEREECDHFDYCQPPSLLISPNTRVKITEQVRKIKDCFYKKGLSLVKVLRK